jgi:Tfp pilus assembly PilM family ATPase
MEADLFVLMERQKKYSTRQLNEILLTATPEQLAELRHISLKFDLSMDEVCAQVLKLIDLTFPYPQFVFSDN